MDKETLTSHLGADKRFTIVRYENVAGCLERQNLILFDSNRTTIRVQCCAAFRLAQELSYYNWTQTCLDIVSVLSILFLSRQAATLVAFRSTFNS